MKHDNKEIEDQFISLCAWPNAERFFVFDNPRYCALLKCHDKVYTLYIYDSANYGGSAAFKVTKQGILGLHGNKVQVEEQKLFIAELLNSISHQMTAKG